MTTLRAHTGRRLAKRFALATNGVVTAQAYDQAKWFSAERVQVVGIRGLHRLLRDLERDPHACIIRGEAGANADTRHVDRRKVENGGVFAEVPGPWVMLDFDGIPLPPGCSVLANPEDVARVLVDLLAAHAPEMEGVTVIVQFSASAGLDELAAAEAANDLPRTWHGVAKAGVSAHVWFWSQTPLGEAELLRWRNRVAAAGLPLDAATLRTVQPHFTAAPVFDAPLRDPLAGRRTILVQGSVDAADLVVPEPQARGAGEASGGSAIAGRGYKAHLAAIGPEGFHRPALQAAAAFVATNWPSPDIAVLKADLRRRIDDAEPNGRSAAEIEDRASDRHLDSVIGWVMQREEAKRGTPPQPPPPPPPPVAPTYPDRSVPIAEAHSAAAADLARFAARIAAGKMPQLLFKRTVGSGKTFDAIDALPAILDAGRAAGRGPVLFLHPRHTLGDQIAADIGARHPALKVAIWRGMDADDPANPGRAMCRDPALPRAARAAGQSATAGCPACPFRPGCAYRGQAIAGVGAEVWLAPHHLLFMTPFAGWPRVAYEDKPKPQPQPPAAVIIDEDITGTGIEGMNPLDPVQLALSALASDETPNLTGNARGRLLDIRARVLASLIDQPAGGLSRHSLEWLRERRPIFTPDRIFSMSEVAPGPPLLMPEAAREWATLEWDCKPCVKIGKSMSRDDAMAAFAAAAGQGFTKLRPMLAERLSAFLASPDARSVNLTLVRAAKLGRGQGDGPAVRFAWRQDAHPKWKAPLLFLDATARPEVLRHWAPRLEVVDIEVAAPHQCVVQVADQEFGRRWLQKPGNAADAADIILVELARASGDVLAVLQKRVEALIRTEITDRGGVRDPLPEGGSEDDPSVFRFPTGGALHLAHHGDVTGSNAWSRVATVIVIGRPATNRLTGERIAEVISGKAVAVMPDADDSWWATTPAGIRMADGSGHTVARQPAHPDPLVEAYRWSVTEGSVLQAIGRARGVWREAGNPVRVVLLAAMALPLTVAEVTPWAAMRPDRLIVAAAEAALFGRALPLAPEDLSKAREDLWETPKAAERFLAYRRRSETPNPFISSTYKGIGGFAALAGCRYRKAGGGGRWSLALVPREAGRAALEAALGAPVAAYALVTPDPEPPLMQDAPMPEPPPEPPSPTQEQRDRLAGLSARLRFVEPPRLWNDILDGLRLAEWRHRRSIALGLPPWMPPPDAPAPHVRV